MILGPKGGAMAERLRGGEAITLGEIFSFLSGLYFRGKLAYASRFAETGHVLVITPHQGLLPAATPLSLPELESFSTAAIDAEDEAYRRPLEIDLIAWAERKEIGRFIFLGSLASGKYVDILREFLGERLFFPVPFLGRGNLSRGSLLLRQAEAGVEMEYAPIAELVRERGTTSTAPGRGGMSSRRKRR